MEFSVASSSVAFSALGLNMAGSAIDASLSVVARTGREVISLAMGSPAPDAIPVQELAEIASQTLASAGSAAALDYTPTEGAAPLRRALLDYLDDRGSAVDPDCVLITAGGMQGLDLACKLFIDPGDLVIAESPSYANGLATIHNYGAQLVQVPLHKAGMDIDTAREVVRGTGRRPKLIYAIPSFQNPSGVTYSLDSRLALLAFAEEMGALVLEDDPYGELRYGTEHVPTVLELDGGAGRVIQVRTFSKIVAPGLRVGWTVAPKDVIRRMVAAKQSVDTCANSLGQFVLAEFLRTGMLDNHIQHLRTLYPRRRDAMIGALEVAFSTVSGMAWSNPSGGMFIWLELPESLDGDQLQGAALREGVAIVPGSAFDPSLRHAVRLCFTACNERLIQVGVERMGRAVASMSPTARSGHAG